MSDERTTKVMTCVLCGTTRAWPDGFPSRQMAECWECLWLRHVRDEHPKRVRQIRREVRKRARRLTERDMEAAMSARERVVLLGHRGIDDQEAK